MLPIIKLTTTRSRKRTKRICHVNKHIYIKAHDNGDYVVGVNDFKEYNISQGYAINDGFRSVVARYKGKG